MTVGMHNALSRWVLWAKAMGSPSTFSPKAGYYRCGGGCIGLLTVHCFLDGNFMNQVPKICYNWGYKKSTLYKYFYNYVTSHKKKKWVMYKFITMLTSILHLPKYIFALTWLNQGFFDSLLQLLGLLKNVMMTFSYEIKLFINVMTWMFKNAFLCSIVFFISLHYLKF